MKNIAIINGIDVSAYVKEPLVGEKNTLDLMRQFSSSLPYVQKKIVLTSSDKQIIKGFELFSHKEWNTEELLKAIDSLSENFDTIFYFYADCPYLDPKLAEKMFSNHLKYMADYTYADGYPYGFSTEIIKTDIVNRLISLNKGEKNKISRQTIFDIIRKDINAFDIETELSPRDQRILRVSLCADTKRNFLQLKRIAALKKTDSPSICSLLDENSGILRTLPSYFSIQITGGCPQECSYCPYPLFGKKNGTLITENTEEMNPERFDLIISKISDFCEDAVISISLWGEPSRHSGITDIVKSVLNKDNLLLIIETSGIGWKPDILDQLCKLNTNSLKWIISLDAWTKEVYSLLRGDGFSEAYGTAETLMDLNKKNVYIQAVRMKENEDDLEHFYINWQKKTENIIIQKYDNFCGVLPDKKVTDLSPLKRFPCWHIKRDMNIRIDGKVPLCREDTNSGIISGNIFSDSLSEIWEKGQSIYINHLNEKYPEICRKCDEYYTFNF